MAKDLLTCRGEIVAAVGTEAPCPTARTADQLAARLGLGVRSCDTDDLHEQGTVQVVGDCQGWPLFDVHQANAVDSDLVAGIGAEPEATLAASIGLPVAHTSELGTVQADILRACQLPPPPRITTPYPA